MKRLGYYIVNRTMDELDERSTGFMEVDTKAVKPHVAIRSYLKYIKYPYKYRLVYCREEEADFLVAEAVSDGEEISSLLGQDYVWNPYQLSKSSMHPANPRHYYIWEGNEGLTEDTQGYSQVVHGEAGTPYVAITAMLVNTGKGGYLPAIKCKRADVQYSVQEFQEYPGIGRVEISDVTYYKTTRPQRL